MFGTNRQFLDDLHNDVPPVINDVTPSMDTPLLPEEVVYSSPSRVSNGTFDTADTPTTVNPGNKTDFSSILLPRRPIFFHTGDSVIYNHSKSNSPPVRAVVLSVDAADPLDITYEIRTQGGLIVDTVSRYLAHAPPSHSIFFSLNDKVIYSKKGSPPLLVTIHHVDHPAYVVQRADGTEFHTLFKFLTSIDSQEVDCFSDTITNATSSDDNFKSASDGQSTTIFSPSPSVVDISHDQFSPGTRSVVKAFGSMTFKDRENMVKAPMQTDALFDGTPSKMHDLQLQLSEFIELNHLEHTGFLTIPDQSGVERDIFRDAAFLKLPDFERADKLYYSDDNESSRNLRKISALLFQKLQNLCNPEFQATMRSTYKPFYSTSFLLYYSYMLEHCNLSGVGAVIDMEVYMEQLTHTSLTTLFKTHLYDVIRFFAAVIRIMESLHRIGGHQDSMCGPMLVALATCPDPGFVRFILNHRRDFVLHQGLFSDPRDSIRFDLLRKDVVAEYSLLTKDNRYDVGVPADGFVLVVAGKKTPTRRSPDVETSSNKKDWEYHPPPPGTSQKKDVDGEMHYWCTGHAKSRYSTAFVNTGQWVKHKPHECRMKKRQQEKKDERAPAPALTSAPSALVNATNLPAVTPAVSTLPLTYAGVASGETLPMRAKLKALIDNADPSKMASLYAAAMADDLSSGEEL
jgi:hypothetical protein